MSTPVTFAEILARDGRLVYTIRGSSMKPMLLQDRDLVVIHPAGGRLKKLDVALYRRGKDHVLHRVIRVLEHGYLIRGDNTYADEIVPEEDVVGVLTASTHKNRQYSTDSRAYRCYARLWTGAYPVRRVLVRWRRAALKRLHTAR